MEFPLLDELEDFYYEVYGYDPDPSIIEDFVLPLPADILEKTIPVLEKIAGISPAVDTSAPPLDPQG